MPSIAAFRCTFHKPNAKLPAIHKRDPKKAPTVPNQLIKAQVWGGVGDGVGSSTALSVVHYTN